MSEWAVLGLDGPPIQGNSEQIKRLGRHLQNQARIIRNNYPVLKRIADNKSELAMDGNYASKVEEAMRDLPEYLNRLAHAYDRSGKALSTYSLWQWRAWKRSRGALAMADSDLNYAKRLVNDAIRMRDTAEAKCVQRIRAAVEDTGIQNRSSLGKFLDSKTWDRITKVLTVAAAVIAIVAVVIGSGGLGFVALGIGAVGLVDAWIKYRRGRGDLVDVGLATLGVIPGFGALGKGAAFLARSGRLVRLVGGARRLVGAKGSIRAAVKRAQVATEGRAMLLGSPKAAEKLGSLTKWSTRGYSRLLSKVGRPRGSFKPLPGQSGKPGMVRGWFQAPITQGPRSVFPESVSPWFTKPRGWFEPLPEPTPVPPRPSLPSPDDTSRMNLILEGNKQSTKALKEVSLAIAPLARDASREPQI